MPKNIATPKREDSSKIADNKKKNTPKRVDKPRKKNNEIKNIPTKNKEGLKTKNAPYFNREISWLKFNRRVLTLASSPDVPLLERVKFLSITASNLDEFTMVRMGSLHVLSHAGRQSERDPSGSSIDQQLKLVRTEIQHFMDEQYRVLEDLEAALANEKIIRYSEIAKLRADVMRFIRAYVIDELLSVVTPMPLRKNNLSLLNNLGLYLLVRLANRPEGEDLWVMPLFNVQRFVQFDVPLVDHAYMAVEDVVRHHLEYWFEGQTILEAVPFRLTRNADFAVKENEVPDLIVGMENVIDERIMGFPVRLGIDHRIQQETLNSLMNIIEIEPEDIIRIRGLIDLSAMKNIAFMPGFERLKDKPWEILPSPDFEPNKSIFPIIAQGDKLLIHPYESFDPVIRLVEEAATDPNVLAIKQILYRSGSTSRIADALMLAAENGKSVTVIVELKARFDEERNIDWARRLERAGVQVIYGIKGLKTHAKICMVVRREPNGIVRYMHFGTGNYNAATAKLYSDCGLFTASPLFSEDATHFFNTICGVTNPIEMNKLAMAPIQIREHLISIIHKAIETVKGGNGLKAKLTLKLNSLSDPDIILKLYEASCAGVKIRLNIRGICMLVPRVKGWSENIKVVSVVDRFLEHARIIHLKTSSDERVWISSADWMTRNLNRRIELLIPVEDRYCMRRLVDHLETFFKDNTNAWTLDAQGEWMRLTPENRPPFNAQHENYLMTKNRGHTAKKNKPVTFEPFKKQRRPE